MPIRKALRLLESVDLVDNIPIRARAYRDLRLIWSTHTAFHVSLYEYDGAYSKWLSRLIHALWETSERYRFAMLRCG